MKKTIVLNIAGIVFHVDEDAYLKLKNYLEEINKHFSGKKDQEDIIRDIENRIAELFQQSMSAKKQVVTLQDVNDVIHAMGHPADFDHDSEEDGQGNPRAYQSGRRRLYRNTDDRLLGGVCSGLGAYFNIDTVWVRVLFILAIWVGVSLLLYIILWLIIPPATTVAEKLEMQGDPVTIANIEHAIREEVSEIKEKLEDLTQQARQTFRKKR